MYQRRAVGWIADLSPIWGLVQRITSSRDFSRMRVDIARL